MVGQWSGGRDGRVGALTVPTGSSACASTPIGESDRIGPNRVHRKKWRPGPDGRLDTVDDGD